MKKINLLAAILIVASTVCAVANNRTMPPNRSTSNEPTAAHPAAFNGEAGKQGVRTKIVKFAKGKTSAVYEENLAKGGVYKFIVAAKKNQVIAIRVGTDSGDVTFNVAHNGKTIPSSVDTEKWTDKLSSGGNYQINVKRKSGGGKFKIEIVVE